MILSSVVGQVVLIITLPILSRLYSPNEFGLFTIFSNIAMVLIPIINGRYDILIINSENEHKANILSQISFVISIVILSIVTPITLCFIMFYPTYLLHSLIFIIMLLLVSLTNIFTSYLNREKQYKILSLINLFRILFMSILQILLGYFSFGAIGLIIGFSFSYIAGIGLGYKTFKKHFYIIKDKEQINRELKANIKQLQYSMPSMIINSISFTLTIFLIGLFFSNKEVGLYGMATRVLGVPVTIISSSLSKIFLQQANDFYISNNTFKPLLIKFSALLVSVSCLMYFPIYLLNSDIVTTILGSGWEDTIKIIKIQIPMFMIRLVVSTISLTVVIFKKQYLEMIFQGLFLLVIFFTFLISNIFNLNFLEFVSLNTAGTFLAYVTFYIMIYMNSKAKILK